MSVPAVNEVTITGAAVLTAVGWGISDFAAALRAGRSGIRADPEDAHGLGAPLRGFELRAWAERYLTDEPETASRLLRVAGRAALPARTAAAVALAAMDDAGLRGDDTTALVIAGNNLALGYHADVWQRYSARPGSVRPSHALSHMDTDAIGVVSELTGVCGEGCTVGGASASGTLAVIAAARLVSSGEVDACLVVAPAAELSPTEVLALRASGAMASRDSDTEPELACKPFDERRRGFVPGQGAAAVVLESLAAATERGARPLATVAGYGQRLDGRRGTEPDPTGQVRALRQALRVAGLSPAEVDYVNAHGTGSVAGDSAEAAALTEVFGHGARPLVNSTKPFTGHCLTAAGLVELVATVVQMREGFLHGNPTNRQPIPDAPALIGPGSLPATVRTAVSHSVGFSGINASIVVRAR